MFKLPVCPHCKTVYRYGDTIQAVKNKNNICYHCKKEFKARYISAIILLLAFAIIIGVAIDIAMLYKMIELNLVLLFIINIILIVVFCFLLPFFVKFKKTEIKSSNINR